MRQAFAELLIGYGDGQQMAYQVALEGGSCSEQLANIGYFGEMNNGPYSVNIPSQSEYDAGFIAGCNNG